MLKGGCDASVLCVNTPCKVWKKKKKKFKRRTAILFYYNQTTDISLGPQEIRWVCCYFDRFDLKPTDSYPTIRCGTTNKQTKNIFVNSRVFLKSWSFTCPLFFLAYLQSKHLLFMSPAVSCASRSFYYLFFVLFSWLGPIYSEL